MGKTKLRLVLLASMFTLGSIVQADVYIHMFQCSDNQYDFFYSPPENAEINKSVFIRIEESLEHNNDLITDTIRVARIGEDLYLEMFSIYQNSWELPAPNVWAWVKARIENGSLVFPNREELFVNSYLKYELTKDGYRGCPFPEEDKVKLFSIDLGEKFEVDCWRYSYCDPCDFYRVEYKNQPLEAEILPNPLLIRYPNSYFLLTPHNKQDSICKTLLTKNEILMEDFIIGNITDKEPETLPRLEAYYHVTESNAFAGIEVRMEPITDDGYLLDFTRMYIVYRKRGCTSPFKTRPFGQFGRSSQDEGFFGNPFEKSSHARTTLGIVAEYDLDIYGRKMYFKEPAVDESGVEYESWKAMANTLKDFTREGKLEVMCYYLKKDGSRVETPWVTAVKKIDESGVESVVAAPQIEDGRTYDITGREVKGDVLTPGIYIRNGRKFIVPRR